MSRLIRVASLIRNVRAALWKEGVVREQLWEPMCTVEKRLAQLPAVQAPPRAPARAGAAAGGARPGCSRAAHYPGAVPEPSSAPAGRSLTPPGAFPPYVIRLDFLIRAKTAAFPASFG
jgi:hypothetical protein